MRSVGDPERAARAVSAALSPDADHVELRRAAARALRGHVDHDVAVWATVDPVTAMWTSCVLDGMDRDPELEAVVFANEYGQDDVLKLVDLAAAGRAATAVEATRGDLAASARHREVLGPEGVTDELRVVFTDGTTPWGALVLLRTRGVFERAELRTVDAVARPVALALRAALVRSGPPAGGVGAPAGTLLLTPDGTVTAATDEALQLLGWAGPDVQSVARLPQVLASVVAARRAQGRGAACLPTTDGRWLSFTATTLAGSDAVTVELLPTHRFADVLLRARGLTPRERDVLALLAGGATNRQAARTLGISDFTVADHLKSLFAKLGVGSRAEMAAVLFADAFQPLHRSLST